MPRLTALPERFLIGISSALVILLAAPAWSAAQGQPAIVEGTSQLFIRRGPGREFPPFATLTGGSQVRLQERHGAWARVTTASGQVGYVHSKFLRVLDEEPAEEATAPAVTPVAAEATRPQPTATRPQATATRQRPTARPVATAAGALPTATAPIALPPPTANLLTGLPPRPRNGNVQREIERLSEAVEALNRRLDQRFPVPDAVGSPFTEAETGVSGGAILLGLAGVIVGWFFGATYQRNKERGRRSRIRL